MAWFEQPDRGVLYGIFDAARSKEILPTLGGSDSPSECLFIERQPGRIRETAPHVIALDPASPLGQQCLSEGWATRWALFLRAPLHLEGLCQHLRRLLIARLPGSRRVIFRFWDPRVLRSFLPTCTTAELAQFFGEIEAFYAFRDEEDLVDVYQRSSAQQGGELTTEQRVGPAEPAPADAE